MPVIDSIAPMMPRRATPSEIDATCGGNSAPPISSSRVSITTGSAASSASSYAQKGLDTADIVRDGDLTTAIRRTVPKNTDAKSFLVVYRARERQRLRGNWLVSSVRCICALTRLSKPSEIPVRSVNRSTMWAIASDTQSPKTNLRPRSKRDSRLREPASGYPGCLDRCRGSGRGERHRSGDHLL